MAEVVKCEKGHFYDKSEFIGCPHCEAGMKDVRKTTGYRNEVSRYAAEYLEEQLKKKRPQREDLVTESKESQRNISRPDDGKDGKTIGFAPSSQRNYAVTGWLVCIDGPHKGYSFNLYYGHNTIGYSRDNRICLPEDTSMARKDHCSVVYEDRKNCFYLVPQKDQETYLNDQRLTEVSQLKTEDKIKVGESRFVFIAFCGGERKWEKELMRKAARY